ncbi:MAG: hypothetical protein MI863_01615 [Desulfobacterales bacterium]|nr:hypothetical protein [Desulfobacterales bacterium]
MKAAQSLLLSRFPHSPELPIEMKTAPVYNLPGINDAISKEHSLDRF